MSIPYLHIAKAVALRANQLEGGAASVRVSAYGFSSTSAFNSALDGVDVPYLALKQDIIAQEAAIASMIGNSTNPVFRAPLLSVSDNLVSGDAIPNGNGVNAPFIGAFDGFFDVDTGRPMTEGDLQEIERFNNNPGGFWIVPKFLFKIIGTTILHTRTEVYAQGCVYSRVDAESRYDADGLSILPDEMEALWAARVLANLPQEDWFVAEAGLYAQLAYKYEQELFEGKVAKMTLPILPTTNARVDPAHD